MSTHTLKEEEYHRYDIVIAKILHELVNCSPCHETIRLSGFDKKDMEHLLILRIALMARDLYQLPIEISGSWWDGFITNKKICKDFDKIKIVNKNAPNGIWVPSLVEKIKTETECYHLDAIYLAYYKGSCD